MVSLLTKKLNAAGGVVITASHNPAEWNALNERGRATIPKGKLALVFLGSIFEEASPGEKARFLAELPAPARVIWRLFGDRVYGSYRDRLRHG